jgi:NAD-reducing hydrogenase small subunit
MSFLDLDERLIELAGRITLVYSPFMDAKVFPERVDITLVEGAVANEDQLHLIRTVRAHTTTLVSFGDCAVTGNVTALRNALGRAEPVLRRAYVDLATVQGQIPNAPGTVPPLLDHVQPVHQVVPVDVFLPGCPPSADLIYQTLVDLLEGCLPAGRQGLPARSAADLSRRARFG